MSDASKPRSIVRFEWLYLAGVAAWLVAAMVKFSVVGIPSRPPLPFIVLGLALVVALQAFIWFFIARRGSNLVRWLLCVFVVFALLGLPDSWAKGLQIGMVYAALSISPTILQTAALLMLYGKGARLWLSHKGRIPEIVSDVFG